MTSLEPTLSALHAILNRRSAPVLIEPGPTDEELELLLQAGTTVPDHGQLRPYRFVVVRGAGRDRFGEALVAAATEARPDLPPELQEKVRRKAFAAPVLIVLIASPRAGVKIPEWEQLVTASCTGYAIALAAYTLELGAIWKTSGAIDGALLREALDLRPGERILGWVNVGRPARPLHERPRPAVALEPLVSVLEHERTSPYQPAGSRDPGDSSANPSRAGSDEG